MFGFFKKKETNRDISIPVTGQFIRMEDVPDPIFADKLMGEGFAVKPETDFVYSPICGNVVSVFPTKHALSLQTTNGKGVIIHMGVDTVELGGRPFDIYVKEGQYVDQSTKLAKVNRQLLAEEGCEDVIIVAFPEIPAADLAFEITGFVQQSQVIGQIG